MPDTCRFVVDVRTTDASQRGDGRILRAALRSDAVPRSTRIRAAAVGGDIHLLVKAAVAAGRETYVSPTTSDRTLMPFPALKMGPGQSSRFAHGGRIRASRGDRGGIAVYEKTVHRKISTKEYGWKNFGTRASSPTR